MLTRQFACHEHQVVEKVCYLLISPMYIVKAEGIFGVQGVVQSTYAWITSNAVICQHAHLDSYLRKPLRRASLPRRAPISNWTHS